MSRTKHRSGNALILVTGTLVLVFSMISLAVTTYWGDRRIEDGLKARQQATTAAEAIAVLKETRLASIAATNELADLVTNPDAGTTNWRGDAVKAATPWEGVDYFGGCLVRWRVEPVVVVGTDRQGDAAWAHNPPLRTRDQNAAAENNAEFYHFRVTAEAHALKDRMVLNSKTLKEMDQAKRLPWQEYGIGTAHVNVQAQRVVQLKLASMFKYALFYAAKGRDGDIEIHNGPAQRIRGEVHSNGAIFCGGGDRPTFSSNTDSTANYSALSGSYSDFGGSFLVGTKNNPEVMTAVDGVFAVHKYQLLMAHRDPSYAGDGYVDELTADQDLAFAVWGGNSQLEPLPNDPRLFIPEKHDISDFNKSRKVNDVSIVPGSDSRFPVNRNQRHGGAVRDSTNGGAFVSTPFDDGTKVRDQPLEAHRLFLEGTQIWTLDPANPTNVSYWTILPNAGNGDGINQDVDFGGFFVNGLSGVEPSDALWQTWRDDRQNVSLPYASEVAISLPTAPASLELTKNPGPSSPPRLRDFAVKLYWNVDPRQNVVTLATNLGVAPKTGVPNGWVPVDAAGLRQYYQRTSANQTDNDLGDLMPDAQVSGGRALHVIDGNLDTRIALDIVDLFDHSSSGAGTFNFNPYSTGAVPQAMNAGLARQDGIPVTDRRSLVRGVATAVADGVSDNAVMGPFFRKALYGDPNIDQYAGKMGFVIRERTFQVLPPLAGSTTRRAVDSSYVATEANLVAIPDPWQGMPWRPSIRDYSDRDVWATDYANYLQSQYMVSFGPYDMTEDFFREVRSQLSTSTETNDRAALEGMFSEQDLIERRKQLTLHYVIWDLDDRLGNTAWKNHRVSMLTLNMKKLLAYLGSEDASVADSSLSGKLASNFHGMIFVERRRRSEGCSPWNQPNWSRLYNFSWYQPNSNAWQPPAGVTNASAWLNRPSGYFQSPGGMTVNVAGNTLPAGFDWRVPAGVDILFHSAVRLHKAEDLDYGQYYDDGTYEAKRGLTVVTPNPLYLWGNTNVTMYADSTGSEALGTRAELVTATLDDGPLMPTNVTSIDNTIKWNVAGKTFRYLETQPDDEFNNDPNAETRENFHLPPMAVFSDNVSLLSQAWEDEDPFGDPTAIKNRLKRIPSADDTCAFTSIITGNAPTRMDGRNYVIMSGGQHNLIRYLENWKKQYHHTLASVVCVGPARYSMGAMGANGGEAGLMGKQVYSPPIRDFNMNSDLFSSAGQPPFTPFSVHVSRIATLLESLHR